MTSITLKYDYSQVFMNPGSVMTMHFPVLEEINKQKGCLIIRHWNDGFFLNIDNQ